MAVDIRKFDSSCDDVRFCSMYAHKHCSIPTCRDILPAVGGGGDDGRGVDGYDNARICVECGDDSFLICNACAEQDPRCGVCRAEAAEREALAACDSATCRECHQGAA